MKKAISLFLVLLWILMLTACAGQPQETTAGTEEAQPAQTIPEQTEQTELTEATEQPQHVYDNDCDEVCNECGQTRTVSDHTYSNACDPQCDSCGELRVVSDHEYDDDCDTRCNNCNEKRISSHGGNVDRVGLCMNCGDYAGLTMDANSWTTVEFAQAQTLYVRVATGQNMKQSIQFESSVTFDYTAYISAGDTYQQVALTEIPEHIVSADYIYLVITQKEQQTAVVFQIAEE